MRILEKLKFRMWKGSWVILIGFILVAFLDFFSTFSVGELVKYMETNPVYLYGGWIPVIFLNIVALYILLKAYDSKKTFDSYMAICVFIYVTSVRIVVSINNFSLGRQVSSGEITQVMVEAIPTEAKLASYAIAVVFNLILPVILNFFVYFLFTLDHKVRRNE